MHLMNHSIFHGGEVTGTLLQDIEGTRLSIDKRMKVGRAAQAWPGPTQILTIATRIIDVDQEGYPHDKFGVSGSKKDMHQACNRSS